MSTLSGTVPGQPSAEWKKKDAAIASTSAQREGWRAHGATSTNELVNVVDFIEKQLFRIAQRSNDTSNFESRRHQILHNV